jgi:hypothetical protein
VHPVLPVEEVPVRGNAVALAVIITALLSVPTTAARSSQPRELTFEDRVKAREPLDHSEFALRFPGSVQP